MKFSLYILAIALSVSLPSPVMSTERTESRSASSNFECVKWLSTRSVDDDSVFQAISKNLACYDGTINQEAGEVLIEWLNAKTSEEPALVIRSRGGLVSTGLRIGKAIVDSEATIFVSDICGSSCANYVFSPAKRRFILQGSLVLYHGGVSEALIATGIRLAQEQISDIVTDPEKAAENIEAIELGLRRELKDQRALMRKAGVRAKFFELYSEFDIASLPSEQCTSGIARNAVFLTRDQYSRIGISTSGEIVDTIEDVEEILASLDIGNKAVCFAPEILFQADERG